MTIKRKLTSIGLAAAIAATSALPLAGAANAYGWKRGGHEAGFSGHNWSKQRHLGKPHRYQGRNVYVYEKRRNNVGTAVAIGLGALILGLAISDSARHDRHIAD